MEKLRGINEGNAEIKNVYFGFENLFPTKNRNISDIPKKGKKGKKSKSKSKEKIQKNKNSFNQTYPIKNYNEFDNSNYKVKGSKYIQKPVKIIKTDEEREQEYFEEKNKKKKNSKKKKSKNKIKEKVTENEENELIEVNNKKSKNISKKKVKEEENSENEENCNKKIKKKKKKEVNEEEEEEIIENEKNNKRKSKTKKKNKTKEEEPKIIKEEQKENKIKKEKKNKSKEKVEEREINEDENHEEIIIISNIKVTKSKEKSKEKKNKNKTKKKRVKKKEEREITKSDDNDNDKDDDNEAQSENKEKKKKKKSNTKSKEKSRSKSKSKTKTQKSSNTEEFMEKNRTQIKKLNKKIDEGTDMEPEYNEIKDDAMNFVDKHIKNLSLTFNDNKLKNNKNKSFKTINKNNKNSTNNNFDLNDTLLKRPYTAHGYKAKSKTKRQIKTSRPINEEEKIMAFKEKVLVHDKILSLFNNNLFQKNLKDEFTQTKKPKKSNSKHYMMPKKKDIIKQNKMKKKEIIYYNDKPEEDPDEIKPNEEDENNIKNKNNNAIKLMTSSKKYFTKSNQALNDIDKILTKKNMDTFINNFMCKNNLNLDLEEEKAKTYYQNNQYPYVDISKIKYYHGGKTYYRPKSANRQNPQNNNRNKLNNSDINLKNHNYRHIFNPNEIISNPNNKFNFFSQTFTKQPIYGKYYNPPEVEDSFNNNISYIESNKWNGRYILKKYTYEEKENPNDVFNYDYKYDDLNDDSDNELPSTNFKARTLPKYKKIDIEYKDNKTGKIVGGKNDNKIDNKLFQDNGDFDKAIYHPFLIDDDTVNI